MKNYPSDHSGIERAHGTTYERGTRSASNREYKLPPLEKGVPIPMDALRFDKRNIPRSPWAEHIRCMEAGDSFVVGWGQAQRLRQHFAFMGIPCLYSVLKDSHNARGTVNVRIWRI